MNFNYLNPLPSNYRTHFTLSEFWDAQFLQMNRLKSSLWPGSIKQLCKRRVDWFTAVINASIASLHLARFPGVYWNKLLRHLGMLILYTTLSCSTAGEVISTALYCKHWSYSPCLILVCVGRSASALICLHRWASPPWKDDVTREICIIALLWYRVYMDSSSYEITGHHCKLFQHRAGPE